MSDKNTTGKGGHRLNLGWWILCLLLLLGSVWGYRKLIPVIRAEAESELMMLGDLDGDHRWTPVDLEALRRFHMDPFTGSATLALKTDLNANGRMDAEDLGILELLSQSACITSWL